MCLNIMNNYGVVFDDIGMEFMLNYLMICYLKFMVVGVFFMFFSFFELWSVLLIFYILWVLLLYFFYWLWDIFFGSVVF